MPSRLALCVGINAYPTAPLRGCVNDATDWKHELGAAGYDTTVLLDGAATKANVVAALRDLVGMAKWGTRIVFTFSGHGTYLPDRGGDEVDGRDEALCCFDYATGGLLVDDELQEIAAQVPRGARLTILSDSCHSGTVARFAGDGFRPGAADRIRFLSPAEIRSDMTVTGAAMLERNVPLQRSRVGAALVSGCADPEYSYDALIAGRYRGAFTAAAIEALHEVGPKASLARWHRAIRKRLPSAEYPQTPQLSASLYQRYSRAL